MRFGGSRVSSVAEVVDDAALILRANAKELDSNCTNDLEYLEAVRKDKQELERIHNIIQNSVSGGESLMVILRSRDIVVSLETET